MWVVLSFLTAVFTSVQDILAKRLSSGKVSPYVVAWAWTFFSLPLLLVSVLCRGSVTLGPQFWLALVTGTILLTFSSVCLFKAIEAGDLSMTLPLLSLTPLLLLITSPLMVGEVPSHVGLIGIFLIVIGSYILYYRFGEDRLLSPFQRMLKAKSTRYMLLVVVLFSIGGNIDKIGTLNSSPLFWSLVLNLAVSTTLGLVMLARVSTAGRQIRANWPVLLLLGCAMALMMIVQMNAIVLTKVPYLIAIKRTSIVLSSLWGVWFLKEQGGWQRILAAVIMLAGVFVISFAQ